MKQLDDLAAVDGVVDRLPGFEAGERRLAGVEEHVHGAEQESGVDPGRVPDGERAVRQAVIADIDEIRAASRHC